MMLKYTDLDFTVLQNIERKLATPVGSLLNALQAGFWHSVGRWEYTVSVTVTHVPNMCLYFSPKQGHNGKLTPCLYHLTHFWKTVRWDFIGYFWCTSISPTWFYTQTVGNTAITDQIWYQPNMILHTNCRQLCDHRCIRCDTALFKFTKCHLFWKFHELKSH